MKHCNECGAGLPDEALFCTNCGNKISIPEARKCSQCQAEYQEGDRFCNNCGNPLTDEPQPESIAGAVPAAGTDAEENQSFEPETEPAPVQEPEEELVIPAEEPEIVAEEPMANAGEPEIADEPETIAAASETVEESTAEAADPEIIGEPKVSDKPEEETGMKEPEKVAERRFCPQCGHEFIPGAVFCRSCGNNLKLQSGQQPAVAPYQPPAVTGYANYQQPQAAPAWQQPAPPPPKKKKKGLLVALIIILVVVLAGGATYIFAGRSIRRLIMGNKAAYIALESEQLRRNATDMVDMLVDLGNRQERSEIGGQTVELQFDLSDNQQFMDPSTLAVLENITWRTRTLYDRQGGSARYFAGLDILAGNEELLKIEGYYDENQLIVGLPGLLDKFIWAQGDDLDMLTEDLELEIGDVEQSMSMASLFLNMDLGIDEAKLKASVYKIIDIVLEHIDEAEFESGQTLRVGQVMNEYDKYTITIGHESARQMMLEILTVLRDDREIFSLVNEFMKFSMTMDPYAYEYYDYYEDDPISWTDWQDNLDSLIDELENSDDDEEFTIIQSIYVDKDDQIVGREIRLIDEIADTVTTIRHYQPVMEDQEAQLIQVETEEETVELRNIYRRRDDKLSGRLTYTVDSSEYISVDYTDYQKSELNGRSYILGDFSINMPVAGDAGMPTAVNYSGSIVQGQFVMNLGIPDLGSIKVGYQEISPDNVVFPTYQADVLVSVTDQEGLYGLMTEDVMERLYSIAMELGFMPDDLDF